MNKKVCAIVLAAGSGSRMNSNTKKQFLPVNDKPLIYYSINTLSSIDEINEIILVTASEDIGYVKEIKDKYSLSKVKAVVTGGATRQESVLSGVKNVSEEYDFVLIHDGARPFVKKEDVINVINDGIKYNSAALGVKVKDTIKVVDENGFSISTPDRESLASIQTPQVVNRKMLLEGFEKFKNTVFTDDTGVLEALGVKTKITLGSYSNIKITVKEDLIYLKDLI